MTGASTCPIRAVLRRIAWQLGVGRNGELGTVATLLWCVFIVLGDALWVAVFCLCWYFVWLDWLEIPGHLPISIATALIFTSTLWVAVKVEVADRRAHAVATGDSRRGGSPLGRDGVQGSG